MIQFKIYNSNNLRKYNGFTSLKDPYILENTLLEIINQLFSSIGTQRENSFNINNPKIANLYFNYYTINNLNHFGEYPIAYIYNDIIRNIQNRNTNNNFILTLESIFISYDEFNRIENIYDCINDYVCENYLSSYNYIMNNNNSVMVTFIHTNDGVLAYILASGFDSYRMCKWFCSSTNPNDMDSLPYTRYISLKSLINTRKKIDKNLDMSYFNSAVIQSEMSDAKIYSNIKRCINDLKKYEISYLKKKSIYDTEIKYGNYPIDYTILEFYDSLHSGCIVDNRMTSIQNEMIKIHSKKKEK